MHPPRRVSAEEAAAAHVFLNSYIPRRLDEVAHFERDAARLAAGGEIEGIYFQSVTGLVADGTGAREQPVSLAVAPPAAELGPESRASEAEGEAEEEGEASSGGGEGSSSGGEDGAPRTWAERPAAPGKDEVRALRKANKEAAREARRLKLLTKVPKHVKRRATGHKKH